MHKILFLLFFLLPHQIYSGTPPSVDDPLVETGNFAQQRLITNRIAQREHLNAAETGELYLGLGFAQMCRTFDVIAKAKGMTTLEYGNMLQENTEKHKTKEQREAEAQEQREMREMYEKLAKEMEVDRRKALSTSSTSWAGVTLFPTSDNFEAPKPAAAPTAIAILSATPSDAAAASAHKAPAAEAALTPTEEEPTLGSSSES